MKGKKLLILIALISGLVLLSACRGNGENSDSGDSGAGTVEIDAVLTSDDFADNELTVLNVWATWCPPCVNELPELQKASEEYQDKGVEIIGVLQDGITGSGDVDESAVATANTLMENAGANYRVILPDEYLKAEFMGSMQYLPTTFFVNTDGELVKTVVGSNEYEAWGRLIDEALEELEN